MSNQINEINEYLAKIQNENWKKENDKLYNNPIIINLNKEIDRIQLKKMNKK